MKNKDLHAQYLAGVAFIFLATIGLIQYVSAWFLILEYALLAGNFAGYCIRRHYRARED